MKYSDVKVQHIYNVDFNPANPSEFDGKHLAVVLKKNTDNKTVLVVPLTRSSNGEGTNKINIGKISSLPPNLRDSESYLVYNAVRVVNCNDRLFALKDDNRDRIDCNIDAELFNKVLAVCSNEITSIMSAESRMNHHYEMYVESVMEQVVNTAYKIKRVIHNGPSNPEITLETEISYHRSHIVELLRNNITYNDYLKKADRDNGISEIISKCLNDTITDFLQSQTGTGS